MHLILTLLLAWTPPVPGPPTRLFDLGPDPFARGQHRGVDFAAARGDRVRAACTGRVVFAGRVAGVGTVSVRCGAWRVSYAPLTRVAVRAGGRIGAGAHLGRARAALHLGVRREGRRFGYVDPLRFLAARRSPSPPLLGPPQAVRRRAAPRGPPLTRPHPARRQAVRPHAGLAPWPVWLGLILLLTGLVGAGRLSLPYRRQEEAPCRASSISSSSPTTPSSP
jgi:Peptidase family M23